MTNNTNTTWNIENGDYKRIVEADKSYKNHYRNKNLSKKIFSLSFILIFLAILIVIMKTAAGMIG